jgi:hypothetical protein
MRINRLRTVFVVTALSVTSALAASPTIGVASAVGTFTVNSAQVSGNANIFNGSQLKTDSASSLVMLQNGSTLNLGTNSAGTVYNDHFVLQQGIGKIDNLGNYKVQANGFSVQGESPNSQAIVRLNGETLEVASLTGSLKVFNEKGAMLTRVGAGTSSAFKNGGQTGAGAGGGATSTLLYVALGAGIVGLVAAGTGLAVAESNSGSSTSTSP